MVQKLHNIPFMKIPCSVGNRGETDRLAPNKTDALGCYYQHFKYGIIPKDITLNSHVQKIKSI